LGVTAFGITRSVGAEVIFQGEDKTVTLHTDPEGFYQRDLPVGPYTMQVHYNGLPEYRRPLFRVMSSETIVLNIALHPSPSCEAVPLAETPPPTHPEGNLTCDGWEHVAIPSKDGVAFELLIHFPIREARNRQHVYYGQHRGLIPVFAAYDLFTLEANQVRYHEDTHELDATGDVVSTDESGIERRAEAATFKIKGGRVTQIR